MAKDLNRNKISALVITYNEIDYIENCLQSIGFADEIIVVDSYSTDGTYEYLLKHPKVKVIQHPFKNYTSQKAFTLEQASNDWVIFIDADEVVTPSLKSEILATINNEANTHVAFWFRRKFMFQQEQLKYSGWQTDKNYRLFRKSKAAFSHKRIVHETLEVNGTSGILNSKLTHYCYREFSDYKRKMLLYGKLKAKEALQKGNRFNLILLVLKPLYNFIFNYIFRLGILDGRKGVIICYLNALCDWERYLELRRLEQQELTTTTIKTIGQTRS